MASKVEIANLALRNLGESTIESFDEGSEEADIIDGRWDLTRRAILRLFPWSFALTTAELSSTTVATNYDWSYKYTLPADYIWMTRIVYPVTSTAYELPYQIRGQYINVNSSQLWIEYVYDETDTTKWDDTFVQVMALRLAADMASKINPAKEQMLDTKYLTMLQQAALLSGSETRMPDSIGHGFVNARK